MPGWLSPAALSSSSWQFRQVLFMALTAAAAPAKAGAAWQVSQAISIWWWASVVSPIGSIPRSPPTTIRTATKAVAIKVPGTQRPQKTVLQDTRRPSQYR